MGQVSDDQTVAVILKSQIGYERIAMECSTAFAHMFGCSPARIEDLKTVVAEAIINAVQHGNKERPDAKVIVYLGFSDNAINVQVIDEGAGIKEIPPKPDIERIMDNLDPPVGFGTYLIEQLSDRVDFNHMTDEGHAVKISIQVA